MSPKLVQTFRERENSRHQDIMEMNNRRAHKTNQSVGNKIIHQMKGESSISLSNRKTENKLDRFLGREMEQKVEREKRNIYQDYHQMFKKKHKPMSTHQGGNEMNELITENFTSTIQVAEKHQYMRTSTNQSDNEKKKSNQATILYDVKFKNDKLKSDIDQIINSKLFQKRHKRLQKLDNNQLQENFTKLDNNENKDIEFDPLTSIKKRKRESFNLYPKLAQRSDDNAYDENISESPEYQEQSMKSEPKSREKLYQERIKIEVTKKSKNKTDSRASKIDLENQIERKIKLFNKEYKEDKMLARGSEVQKEEESTFNNKNSLNDHIKNRNKAEISVDSVINYNLKTITPAYHSGDSLQKMEDNSFHYDSPPKFPTKISGKVNKPRMKVLGTMLEYEKIRLDTSFVEDKKPLVQNSIKPSSIGLSISHVKKSLASLIKGIGLKRETEKNPATNRKTFNVLEKIEAIEKEELKAKEKNEKEGATVKQQIESVREGNEVHSKMYMRKRTREESEIFLLKDSPEVLVNASRFYQDEEKSILIESSYHYLESRSSRNEDMMNERRSQKNNEDRKIVTVGMKVDYKKGVFS